MTETEVFVEFRKGYKKVEESVEVGVGPVVKRMDPVRLSVD